MIALDLGNLLVHLKADDQIIKQVEKTLNAAAHRLDAFGRQASLRITAPLAAIGTAMVKNSLTLESAFTGVRKTVDATEQQFTALKAGLDEMAGRIPLSIKGIYGIAEAAGQLGIETPNLLKFTETIAALGVTTNLTSHDAAMSLARFANIMQMPQESVDRLGSVIVELGNNMATTEREIVEMALRMAGASNVVGMTESQVMSLAGAFSSVGMEAEAGGTAINTILLKMYNAVQSGGKELRLFAATAGQSMSDFSESFRKDAAGAFTSFVEGLGKLHKSGANVSQVLEAVGMDNVRVTRSLLSAASAGDLLRVSLDMGARAWEENNALVEEANKRYATQESRLSMLWNRIRVSAEAMGNVIAGKLLTFTSKVIDPIIQGFKNLDGPTQNFIVDMSIMAAMAGPVAIGFATVMKVVLGLKAALLLTVSAGTLLQTTFAGIFVAVAGYKLGKYLYQEFESVATTATVVAGTLMKTWETIKYGLDQGITYLKMGWNKFKVWWMNMAADVAAKATQLLQHLEAIASQAAGTVVSLGSVDSQKLYVSLRRAAKQSMEGFNKEIESNKKLYEQQLSGIEKATVEGVAEVHRKFADTGDNAKGAQAAADALNAQADATTKLGKGLATDIDLVNKVNDALGMTAQQTESFQNILGSMNTMTQEAYEIQKRHLEQIARGYKDEGVSVQLVNKWLQYQTELLDIAAGKVGTMAEQLRAASLELQHEAEQAGGPWYQFAKQMPQMMESGFMNILRAGSSWKDKMIGFIEEVAWEMVRLQAIQPLTQGLSQSMMSMFTPATTTVNAATPGVGGVHGFAEGGIAWTPQIARMAEDEPEVNIPFSKLDSVGMGKGTKDLLAEILHTLKRGNIGGTPVIVDRREDVATTMMKDKYRRGNIQRVSNA